MGFAALYPSYGLRHLIADLPDPLDPDFHHIAGLEELLALHADAGRRAGEDEVAGWSARRDDKCEICSASVKIMRDVLESCLITPLTQPVGRNHLLRRLEL
jgi:hypothetical protein